MKTHELSLGLVTEGDRLSLSVGLRLDNSYLTDAANGARHLVKSPARPLIAALHQPVRLTTWLALPTSLSVLERLDMLLFLDSIAGLNVDRSWRPNLRLKWRRLGMRLNGIRVSSNSRRYPATLTGLTQAVWQSMTIVFVLILLTGVGLYGTGLSVGQAVAQIVIFVTCLFGSVLVHELTHSQLAKYYSGSSGYVTVRGMGIGVLHQPLSEKGELASAVLGPLAGVMVCGLWTVIVAAGELPSYTALPILVIGLAHCLSWLPNRGDGQALVKVWRLRYA